MSDGSEIEWTDATWNPVRGCVKVSPGCLHCYAETFAERWRGVPGHAYEQGFDLRLVPEKLDEPLRWREPRRVFVNSMSDLFQKGVPATFVAAVFGAMALAPRHTFQVLTKRPARAAAWFRWLALEEERSFARPRDVCSVEAHGHESVRAALPREPKGRHVCEETDDETLVASPAWPLPNVHIGASVENRRDGLPRIRHLRAVPAALRFLSIEPLLEDLGELDLTGIGWVIVGGESGPGARPMHPAWVRSIRDQCAAAGVPFFFKQWGQWVETAPAAGGDLGGDIRRGAVRIVTRDREPDGHFRAGDVLMRRTLSKKGAGRLLDGVEHNAFPRGAACSP